MDIPNQLKIAIEKNIDGIKRKQLSQDAESISLRYRSEGGQGKRLVTSKNEVCAYSVVRMPATYGACFSVLKNTLEMLEEMPKSLLDVGAGTGAATWAATSLIDLEHIVCFEREDEMLQLGERLMAGVSDQLEKVKWIKGDVLKDPLPVKADLVVASYVFNEMTDEDRLKGILKLWQAAKGSLVIIEPGTPAGYSGLMKARALLLENGGYVLAPCPHNHPCQLQKDDWCHFACRVPRSKLHRETKGGEVPYEDEKYTYLAVVRKDQEKVKARILRHPYIEKGCISLQLCTSDGIQNKQIKKRDNELFKKARKVKWGDSIEIK